MLVSSAPPVKVAFSVRPFSREAMAISRAHLYLRSTLAPKTARLEE